MGEGLLARMRRGLERTGQRLRDRLGVPGGRMRLDEAAWEALEAALLEADVGVRTTELTLRDVRERARRHAAEAPGAGGAPEVWALLRAALIERLGPPARLASNPTGTTAVLVVGVNGAGKTTTAAKLAFRFKAEGGYPILACADTFRAAAAEQLAAWARRLGVDCVCHAPGGDPAAVAFDALKAAAARGAGAVIVDTAGRLHTRQNLMEELGKVARVMGRALPGAPHEVLLVLDATTGQNGLQQARQFRDAAGVTGVALVKLDGTARGGVALAIREELGIPVKLAGVGEGLDDLLDFDPVAFVDALIGVAGGAEGGEA